MPAAAARSVAPRVKRYLYEKLELLTEPQTLVWVVRPNEDYPLGENVYLGDIVKGHRQVRTMGRGSNSQRDESFVLEVEVAVVRRGADGEGTEDRCVEIGEAVEDAIEKDISLGEMPGIVSATITEFELKTIPGPDGYSCLYTFGVEVVANVRPE